jgi:AcrR family transcriptional regulator
MGGRATRRPVEDRRTEILRATVDLVTRDGFEAVRVADVAGALGISPALVYYHFATKDRLVADAFAFAAERELGRLDRAIRSRRSGTEQMQAVLRLYVPRRRTSDWRLWVGAWAAALRSPDLEQVSRDLDLRWAEAVERVIKHGSEQGEFTCPEPAVAAWRICAMLDGLALQSTVHPGPVTWAEVDELIRGYVGWELGVDGALLV